MLNTGYKLRLESVLPDIMVLLPLHFVDDKIWAVVSGLLFCLFVFVFCVYGQTANQFLIGDNKVTIEPTYYTTTTQVLSNKLRIVLGEHHTLWNDSANKCSCSESIRFCKSFLHELIQYQHTGSTIWQTKISVDLTDSFYLHRGTLQGCCAPPLLTNGYKGVTSTKGEQKMASFADDLLLALAQPTQILPKLMTMLEEYD